MESNNIGRSLIHPSYNPSSGMIPGSLFAYGNNVLSVSPEFVGIVVTRAKDDDYYYDPEMKIEGDHYVHAENRWVWASKADRAPASRQKIRYYYDGVEREGEFLEFKRGSTDSLFVILETRRGGETHAEPKIKNFHFDELYDLEVLD
jgi:hypothetical protein